MQRAFILISLGLALTACAANEGDEGIFISKNVAPSTGCTFSAAAGEAFHAHGKVDVASGGYRIFPQLVSKITSTDANVEQRTIQARGARVDIETLDPALSGIASDARHFETRFSAPITPNGGITDAEFIGISEDYLKAVAAIKGTTTFESEVIVHAVVYGDLSGSEVTSQNDWEFPVTVCNHCVVNVINTCPLPSGTIVRDQRGECSMFQDGFVDCCTTSTGQLQCPAEVGAQFTLTVLATGNGTVTSNPAGISCGGDCTEQYNQGQAVTLTQTAMVGSTFTGWTGNCVGTGACVVTMDAAKMVTASFSTP
jgi:Divergent InlB B-repeat domain